MKIAFFGTPDFCVPVLDALHAEHTVVCVVTQPDKPGGRGRELIIPPAKKYANKKGIPVFQPKSISKELELVFANIEKPDIIVTCAFGQILRQNVIDFCKHGVINVHASLLPKYRGPSPINWAIIKGETKTGITIMQTDIGIDTGDILNVHEWEILPGDTAGDLYIILAHEAVHPLLLTLNQIEEGTVKRIKQNHSQSSYYPMLKKSDGKIDFSRPPHEIVNFIRGMNSWPMAFTESNLGIVRVHKASVVDGKLQLDIIQLPGGRPMTYKEFINGHKDFKLI